MSGQGGGSTRKRDGRAALLAMSVALIPYAALFQGELLCDRDVNRLFVPLKVEMARLFAQGVWPSFYAWDGLGVPFAAIPLLGLFHPSTILWAVLPWTWALSLQAILPVLLTAAGCFYLARSLGLPRSGAALASALFSLSGYALGNSEYNFIAWGMASAPWVFWAIRRFKRSPRLSLGVLFACFASASLAGEVVHTLLLLLFGGAFALWLTAGRLHRPPLWKLLAAALLGLGASAAYWLPAAFIFPELARSQGLSLVDQDIWALNATRFARLWFPAAKRSVNEFYPILYLGAAPLLFFPLALWLKRARFWWLLGAAALWLALGEAGGLWTVLSSVVPGWKAIQSPIRVIGFAALPVSLLAAWGFEQAAGSTRRARNAFAFWALGLCALFLGLGYGAACGALTAASFLLWHFGRQPAQARRAKWAAAAILTLELLSHQVGLQKPDPAINTAPAVLYETPEVAAFLHERQRLVGPGCLHWLWEPERGYRPGAPLAAAFASSLVPLRSGMEHLCTLNQYSPGQSLRAQSVARIARAEPARFAGHFGVRWVLLGNRPWQSDRPSREIFTEPDLGLSVREVESDSALVFFPADVQAATSASSLEALAAPDFSESRRSHVEFGSANPKPSLWEGNAGAAVRAIEQTTSGMQVLAESARSSLLVLNLSYWKGLHAEIDGQPVPVYPANHFTAAVAMPPGKHQLTVSYAAPHQAVGAALSFLSALLAMALFYQTRPKRLAR